MKKYFAYLLLILFSFQTFETALICLNFTANQDFFSAICTNKDKPKMQCNGKCHLKKQIEQSKQNEKDEVKTEKEIQIFISQATLFLHTVHPKITKTYSIATSILPPRRCSSAIFHPPKSF